MQPLRAEYCVVGAGFAGLSAAKALKDAPVRVFLIDRTNHHLFQPLLYQVAICALSPAQVAAPIREILASQQNVTVVMGEVVGVDKAKRVVVVKTDERDPMEVYYDTLVVATGAGINSASAASRSLASA